MAALDHSASSLNKFLDMAGSKGLMNPSTAKAFRITCTKVLAVADQHELADVRQIDREALFKRFQNLHGLRYSPGSLSTYRSRFFASLDSFLSYLRDPAAFKPTGGKNSSNGGRPATSPKTGKKVETPKTKQETAAAQLNNAGMQQDNSTFGESLNIPVPIRGGHMIRISGIPADLTKEEANKIAAVILAYATG